MNLSDVLERVKTARAAAAAALETFEDGEDDELEGGPRFRAYDDAMKEQVEAESFLRAAVLESFGLDPHQVVKDAVKVDIGDDMVVVAPHFPGSDKDCLAVIASKSEARAAFAELLEAKTVLHGIHGKGERKASRRVQEAGQKLRDLIHPEGGPGDEGWNHPLPRVDLITYRGQTYVADIESSFPSCYRVNPVNLD